MSLFPKGTMRKSGIGMVGAAPFAGYLVGFGVKLLGFGEECTPEAVEAGCMTAEAAATAVTGIVTSVLGLVGGFTYWKGRNRAAAEGK